jgi:uncharacterized Rossmann fold enzyme
MLNMMIEQDYSKLLEEIIFKNNIAVVGAGPNLTSVKRIEEKIIIAADGASHYLVEELGIMPHIIVTDLDGLRHIYKEPIYVVHAHGDNIDLLYRVKQIEKIVGTSQIMPFGKIKLYGGFTDGDRAVVIARIFGANKIRLYGMDFSSGMIGKYSKPYLNDNVPATRTKLLKLKIAEYIINCIVN